MSLPYHHVYAFTGKLFAGNPAGVCILSIFPADQTMQEIAEENRHSDTTFIVPRADGEFDLRWFTPEVEDDLCGHATLASAFVLACRDHRTWPVRSHTRSGQLTVAREGDDFQMDFPARPPQPCDVPRELLSALDLQDSQVVMKSRDCLVVVDSPEQVRTLAPDFGALAKLDVGIGGFIVTSSSEGDVDYAERFFCPSVGINEDPATGSIQCTLVPYWAARLGKRILNAQQLSACRGEFRCELASDRVKIGGQARLYLKGALELEI